jgi:hypothetical protein
MKNHQKENKKSEQFLSSFFARDHFRDPHGPKFLGTCRRDGHTEQLLRERAAGMVRTSRSLDQGPWSHFGSHSIMWARSGASVIVWAHLRQFSALAHWIARIIWDHWESPGIIRAHLGSNGITQDHLGSSGIIWAHVCSTAMIWDRPESVGSGRLGIT